VRRLFLSIWAICRLVGGDRFGEEGEVGPVQESLL
jgi:hypothetical protein